MAGGFDAGGFDAGGFYVLDDITIPPGIFLVIDDLTVRVQSDAADTAFNEHRLGRERMLRGDMLASRQGVWRTWTVTTALLDTEEALELREAVQTTTLPAQCGGDLFANDGVIVFCFPVIEKCTPFNTKQGIRWRFDLALHEASTP